MQVIVGINTVNYGSTGNIMLGIGDVAKEKGYLFYPAFTNSRSNRKKNVTNSISIGTQIGHFIHSRYAFYTGVQGTGSKIDTWFFLRKLDKVKPDLIHIHNLHDNFINLPMLFSYLKKHNIPVVWTLHDCWSFTGQCPNFSLINCDKWKAGCHDCPQYRQYPATKVDKTAKMWSIKQKWFNGLQNLTIVTPSLWLAKLVKKSYLSSYPVEVINNGIDLRIFKPMNSSFREKYGINNQYIVLGVALGWDKRKGLDVFIDLSKTLDKRFKIVLVGTNDAIDNDLPNNIISIHKTYNQSELAEIYSASDVFVNPTREDNFPTVNIEALACGTPVITFETGGSPEMLSDTCGSVVPSNDLDNLKNEIVRICVEKPYSCDACQMQASNYDMNNCFEKYVDLYDNLRMVEAE